MKILKIITSSRKILQPQISHCATSKYLYTSLISCLSVENEDKQSRIRQALSKPYVIPVRRFYSEYKKSSDIADCIGQQTNGTQKKILQYRFHPETEAALNQQITAELKASFYYLSMASYFGQVDIALPGCETYFMRMHKEEHDHALCLLNYIKTRGGRINLCVINPPDDQNWRSPLHAFQTALDLEISVTDDLVAVNSIAEKHRDLNASDFIITNFIDEQMKSVSEMARFVTVLSGIGDQSLGQFIFDRDLLKNYVQK